MSTPARYRLTWLLTILLAIVGTVFIIDAMMRDGLLRYRLFAWALGALLILPIGIATVFREPGLRLLSRCAFAGVVTLLVVLILEPVLRLAGVGEVSAIRVVADERLGHKLKPGLGGMDVNGFRNSKVPKRVDVLFVGDSQTYGFGVSEAESFPHAFGAATGRAVYGMATGGYGAVQYRELTRQGLTMRPKILVVALYLGNDLWDAYQHAYLPSASDLRREGMVYPTEGSIHLKTKPAPNLAVGTLEGIAELSRFVSLTMLVVRSRMSNRGGFWDDEPGAPRWSEGEIATLFRPEYRLSAVDGDEARIAEGVRITKQCLRDIAADCRRAGARCVLLPIHTKEFCYQMLLARDGRPLDFLAALHAAETRTTEAILEGTSAAGIECLDPTEALVASLADDRAIWPHGSDGHLNAAGHAVVTALLVEKLAPK